MRLGLISDIHGNRIALDAVVADGRACGVDAWWALGDLVAVGPDPVSTLDLLRELPGVQFVRGNTDRYVVSGDRPFPHAADVERDPSLLPLFEAVESSFAWTRDEMGEPNLQWLALLPTSQRLVLADGTNLLGIHASVGSDDGAGITPDAPDTDLAPLLTGADAHVICGGHTHRATDRRVGEHRAVNLGSVSNPITADLRASYVVVDHDRDGHRLQHRRVAYDHDAVLRRLQRSTHPEARYIASFQRGEQVRHPATGPGTPTFAS